MSLLDIIFDPVERQGRGTLQGLTIGVVTDNKDPDGLARIRVRLPWFEDGKVSYWARTAMLMAGKDMGTFFLPEIGDEVLLGAEQGDPSHLYVIGMLWNGQLPPPETNADGSNHKRFIRTREKHELRFSDDPADPLGQFALADGKMVKMTMNGIEVTDGTNKIVIDSGSSTITIESTAQLKIKSQAISIEAGASMELKSSGTLTIKGALVQIN
ncbi:MAG: hypothetical protein IIZ38_19680 [Sphingomonas sp.]|uniref:phage baseplate assembly protein V n=1 Tax=Sphingomonas sp. TaxID=28214 RepID=UPI0025E2A3FB|nr:phage baseplate assembly protein V [Sphingomonas sp.]MBQ1500533.1 hypothetical protein [Sphingomonas sp.]